MSLLSSASKIVFIAMALGAIGGFYIGILSENNFMLLAGSAFAFYFSNKGETTPSMSGAPFLGK